VALGDEGLHAEFGRALEVEVDADELVGDPRDADERSRHVERAHELDALVVLRDVEQDDAVDEGRAGHPAQAAGRVILGQEHHVVVEGARGVDDGEHERHVSRAVRSGVQRGAEGEQVGARSLEHAGAGVGAVVEGENGLFDAATGAGGDRALAADGIRDGADGDTRGACHVVNIRHQDSIV
jgi:hypothetical protein